MVIMYTSPFTSGRDPRQHRDFRAVLVSIGRGWGCGYEAMGVANIELDHTYVEGDDIFI